MHGPFAAVVIATPLELSSIEFEGVELAHMPARKFQSTVTTFVRGHLNGSYFGLKARPKGESLLKHEHRIACLQSTSFQIYDTLR